MPTKVERQIIRKAMAYDLFALIEANQVFDEKTKEEIKKMIYEYLINANQK